MCAFLILEVNFNIFKPLSGVRIITGNILLFYKYEYIIEIIVYCLHKEYRNHKAALQPLNLDSKMCFILF